MQYGAEVEVLSPDDLRRDVSAAVQKTLSLYDSET